MPKLVTALSLVSVIALPAVVLERSADPLKCPSRVGSHPDMPDVIYLIDNEVFEEWPGEPGRVTFTTLEGIGTISSLEIVCWRWVEANFGVEVSQGGVYILTEEWAERTRHDRIAALKAVVAAQDRHREQAGEYAARPEDLPGFGALSDYGLPAHLQLDLTATRAGWAARLVAGESWTHGMFTRMSPLYECVAFEGDAPPPEWDGMAGEGPGLEERSPACFST